MKELECSLKTLQKCKSKNFKKVWRKIDTLTKDNKEKVEEILERMDLLELAVANSYKLYDDETFKLRRRIEQLEKDVEVLQERLRISVMLSKIRESTESLSDKNSKLRLSGTKSRAGKAQSADENGDHTEIVKQSSNEVESNSTNEDTEIWIVGVREPEEPFEEDEVDYSLTKT